MEFDEGKILIRRAAFYNFLLFIGLLKYLGRVSNNFRRPIWRCILHSSTFMLCEKKYALKKTMHKKRKYQLRLWSFSLLNAVFMLFFTYYWLSQPYTFGDEAFLIKWSSLTKKKLLGIDPEPSADELLFINVADNKTTINAPSEFYDKSGYARKVITDRQHLVQFFELLNRYGDEIQLVLCDILFEDTTRYDAALEYEFQKLGDKLLVISHLKNGTEYIKPTLNVNYAPATYTATQGLFLKYPLILEDSLKTVPLVMYEKLNQARFRNKKWYYTLNGKLSLPAPIVDFKVDSTDFRPSFDVKANNFAMYPMSTILESSDTNYLGMPEAELAQYFKGKKIILIADFQSDVHNTSFGKMPGILLIYNAYLTLVGKQNVISFAWICFLLVAFTFITYRIFTDVQVSKPRWLVKMFKSKLGQLILNSLDEVVLLTLVTLLSYFLFNIHVNILILLIYLKILEFLWKKAGLHLKQTILIKRATAPSK